MKPIGQTFYVNEPATGVPGVYITKVDVYFKSVSSIYGIELQIRTTDNGVPTPERLPFGSKVLHVDDVNPPVASDDASVATTFVFDTPVFVQSATSYALVLLPVGGNPDYQVWTAEIGQNDAKTGDAIYTNNDTGDLFLSSNDRDWTPIITEDMKFTIYTAEFTSLSGNAVFRTPDEDYMEIYGVVGDFFLGEVLYPSNGITSVAKLTITSNTGAFGTGDAVYQTNGSVNTAVGVVYSANTSMIKIANASGVFTTNTLHDATSSATATVSVVSQNAVANSSNVFVIPDATLFSNNEYIYISTSNFSKTVVLKVSNTISSTSLQLSANVGFTDNNCIYGKIYNNGALVGGLGSVINYPDFTRIILDNVTSNTSMTFHDVAGNRLIGSVSGASAVINRVYDYPYNAVVPQFHNMAPANTSINWYFKGVQNNSNYTVDGNYIPVAYGVGNELIDYERALASRSTELTKFPAGRIGERSVSFSASIATANSKISPVIDFLSKTPHFIYNLSVPPNYLTGYYLNMSNTSGSFTNGDVITQGSVSGVCRFANATYMLVTDVTGGSFTNTTITDTTSGGSAKVSKAEYFSEVFDNGLFRSSRYISKSVLLAQSQNSEDIIVFIGGYRPATTDFHVYGKFKHDQDNDLFDDKQWSRLLETTSVNLLSSSVNADDLVELVYGFPQSVNIAANGVSCNTSSNTITVPSTAGIAANTKIYINNVSSTNNYIVRTVVSVTNTTALVLDTKPSFVATNAAFGTIPGLESNYGSFLNDQNTNIVRYMNENDLVFDGYSQFSIKIVPVSNSTALVPRAADLRVLAVQA